MPPILTARERPVHCFHRLLRYIGITVATIGDTPGEEWRSVDLRRLARELVTMQPAAVCRHDVAAAKEDDVARDDVDNVCGESHTHTHVHVRQR